MGEDIKSIRKCNFIIPLTGIACLLIGYLAGTMLFPQEAEPSLNKEQIIQETKEAIRDRFIEGGLMPSFPEKIYVLANAKIEEVGKDYLLVTPSAKQDPLDMLFAEKIKIIIDEDTTMQMVELKNLDQYIKELESYEKNPEEFEKPPRSYTEKSAEIGDMKPGNYIKQASSEKNIKGIKEFVAKKIDFSIKQF